MSVLKQLETVDQAWSHPGLTLLVCDPAETSAFWYRFRSTRPHRVMGLPQTMTDFSSWEASLQQSFLGSSEVYWLLSPEYSAKAAKVRNQATEFLRNYRGPHALWLLVNEQQAAELSGVRKIVIHSRISGNELSEMAAYLKFERSLKLLEACHLVHKKDEFSLDTALALLWHADYVPARNLEPAHDFLKQLLPQEHSLTHLAEFFFNGQTAAFLQSWRDQEPGYGDMFWISFWAEQLWRAYWVTFYLKRGQQTRAKSMSFRLPHSFIQSGWRKQQCSTLLKQYEEVVRFDTLLKRGAVAGITDLVTTLLFLSKSA